MKRISALIDYREDGVDLTLIRSFLALTPAGRLAFNDDHFTGIFGYAGAPGDQAS